MDKHGGRVESRRLRATDLVNDYLDWPGVAQVCQIEREVRRPGQPPSRELAYAITSVPWERAAAAVLLGRWRGYWSIENRSQKAFTGRLESAGVAVSMDGRGRALDNVFIERLWRSLKYEEEYIKGYASVSELERGLSDWFGFYNHERPHQGLSYKTPAEVYRSPELGSK